MAVRELTRLEINANAGIATVNSLHAAKLLVMVNGDCDLRLQSTGPILFEATDGYNVEELRRVTMNS